MPRRPEFTVVVLRKDSEPWERGRAALQEFTALRVPISEPEAEEGHPDCAAAFFSFFDEGRVREKVMRLPGVRVVVTITREE